jgi:hypothetical protein
MAFKSLVTASISGNSASPSPVSATVSNGTTHTIIGLTIANIAAANIAVSVKVNKADSTSGFVVKDATVLPGGTIVIVGGDQKLVLEAGDQLVAYASASASADAIISYLV